MTLRTKRSQAPHARLPGVKPALPGPTACALFRRQEPRRVLLRQDTFDYAADSGESPPRRSQGPTSAHRRRPFSQAYFQPTTTASGRCACAPHLLLHDNHDCLRTVWLRASLRPRRLRQARQARLTSQSLKANHDCPRTVWLLVSSTSSRQSRLSPDGVVVRFIDSSKTIATVSGRCGCSSH
jgi:hypothetical protein